MDELKIKSGFMKEIISRLLEKVIYKQFGYKVDLDFDDLEIKVSDTKAVISMDVYAEMDINEFKKITKLVNSRE